MVLQRREDLLTQDCADEVAGSAAHETRIHIQLADFPNRVAVRHPRRGLGALGRDSTEVVEVFGPHIRPVVVGLHGDANIVDEEQEVAVEDCVGEEVVGCRGGEGLVVVLHCFF